MEIGMVGLGRMGGAMAERLRDAGHRVVVYDVDEARVEALADPPAVRPAPSLDALVDALEPPRSVWVMVPAGEPTSAVLEALAGRCGPGDVVVDGGNSDYRDTRERGDRLRKEGIELLDAGTSGGVWGREGGYCLMVGGDTDAAARLEPVFRTLAPTGGYAHVGPGGAGHFVKMVHNGIEYGLLEAYAEGFEILHAAEFDIDLGGVAELWNHGSVIRSWLLELIAQTLEAEGGELERIDDWVADSGEGRWAVETAIELDVPAPVITLALLNRLRSRQESSYAAKMIAALRQRFGGHAVRAAEPGEPAATDEPPGDRSATRRPGTPS